MKILLAQNMIYVPTYGGASKANRLLLEGLSAKGHSCKTVAPAFGTQVSVKTRAQFLAELDARGICLASTSAGVDVFSYKGVEVHAVTDSSELHNQVISQISEFKPNWILVSNDDAGQLMLEAALEASPARVVYLVHTPQALPFGPKSFLQNKTKTDLIRQTAGILTESNHVKDYIKQWGNLDSVAIPFPIYGSGPFPNLGCFDKGFVTLINPCAVKGISIFLELARRMPDIAFAGIPTWGTTKEDRGALERLPNVRLLPPVDNIGEIFSQTRILLMPSLWTESFPLTAREAMLHGIPVVGSNSGGLPETMLGVDYTIPVRLIEHYEDRFDELGNPVPVVPDQVIDPWENTLRKLLSDRSLYDQLSAASREAAERFVSSVSVAQFEDYLEELRPAPQVEYCSASTVVKQKDSSESDLGLTLGGLTLVKLELLARRLKKKNADVAKSTKAISRRSEPDSFPLSFAQERLWFLDQWEPDNFAYNNLDAFRLSGRLNREALERSLNEVIRRHESLRATFAAVDGRPVQAIYPTQHLTLPVEDLRDLPEAEREEEARRLITKEAELPFDLSSGPLVRTSLLRLRKEEHILLLNIHHIVSDGWSADVLFREIATLYEAFSLGRPSPLAELLIQYADFAHWQREWLRGEVLEEQLAYWERQLAGAPAVLELPTTRPRPTARSYRGASQSLLLSKNLLEVLNALSQREGVTLFMTLLAAFQALLFRYTNQDDIIVGTPIAGRSQAETEGLIGFLVNTLVLRTDLSADPTFRELLGRVREVALGAYAHQDLPFEKLVEALKPERDLSHTPLFQVSFVLQNAPRRALELSGLTLSPLEIERSTAKFDLTLNVIEKVDGLSCVFEYDTDLFDDVTITRMLGHFHTLLEGIVADPERRLSKLPLLTQAEQQQLLTEWNNTAADYPRRQCIHQLVEEQAERTPNAVAVMFEEERLTYGELNRRANQLAHRLRALGVGPEVLVGICLERSIEMVVGLLGILKAGGAYVPLDAAYPAERLRFMLEDSAVRVLVTQEHLVGRLPDHKADVLCLDKGWEVFAREQEGNPVSDVTPENLAYVIYTSGSTGKPKGVMVPHKGLVNYLSWCIKAYRVAEGRGAPVHSPLGFDLTVTSLFSPLLVGKSLILLAEEQGAEALSTALLSERDFSFVKITPAHLDVLSQWLPAEAAAERTRALIIGGEALSGESLSFWRTHAPNTRLVNEYGPTETVVGCCVYEVPAEAAVIGAVPIGRPIANTQIYLLDRHLNPVPVGVPGELHIGGDGLARGYLNRPELTHERFISHPFSPEPVARLYKTGDLARYLPTGDIEYLSRLDHQVKVRGFRVELGEIEAALGSYPGVRESVVAARENETGTKRLVAYFVAVQEPPPSVGELRGYLKERLPEYMVPGVFVELEALPLTANGKVDRRALPVPDEARPELGGSFVAPRNPAEEVLAGVWAEVLRLDHVGVHDNFFDLGGDSILSIQIIARASRAGLRFTPKQLFQHQTVAELAAVAKTTPPIEAEQGIVTGAVPLTPIQHWFFEQHVPEPHHWNQAMLLEVRQAPNAALLEQTVRHLVEHHDALRLRFVRGRAGWQQVNAGVEQSRVFSQIDLSTVAEAEYGRAVEGAAAELQASLHLTDGPLVRVALFDFGPRTMGRLLIVIHHLAVDGVSWRILLEDLQTAYRQLSRGEEIKLGPKTTSYMKWAERLTAHVQSGAVRQDLEHWLAARRSIGQLPTDHVRGDNSEASAGRVVVSLSEAETRALLQEVPVAYHTQINDALLTALAQAFAPWTKAHSLLVDLEGHGREEIVEGVDLSRTVGWFTTIFPVLLEVEEGMAPDEALKAVKEQLRGVPRRGIGYGMLRYLSEDARIAEQLRQQPQAEVSFNYLGQFDQVLTESSAFGLAKESSGPVHSLKATRRHLLDVDGIIMGGQLQLSWMYSKNVHRHSTIEELAHGYVGALRSLIAHCQCPDAGGYTPSDFPTAKLSQKDLNKLMAKISRVGGREPR